MSKNGSRIISFGRYRATDLLLFAVILVAFDVIMFFAYTKWFDDYVSRFTFSLVVPITLLMMVRWNWYGMFYSVLDALTYCILLVATSTVEGADIAEYFAVFIVGNAFIGFAYLMVRFMGYKRIAGNWLFTVLYVLCGWVCIVLGRSLVSVFFGHNFLSSIVDYAAGDLLSLAVGILLLLVLRRFDGLVERQKDYLKRLDEERQEKIRIDTYGEQPIEIDEESLKTLNKKGDDLF